MQPIAILYSAQGPWHLMHRKKGSLHITISALVLSLLVLERRLNITLDHLPTHPL
jgi:hypothetical protein